MDTTKLKASRDAILASAAKIKDRIAGDPKESPARDKKAQFAAHLEDMAGRLSQSIASLEAKSTAPAPTP